MTVTIGPNQVSSIPDGLLARWRAIPVAVTVDLSDRIRQLDPAIRPLSSPESRPSLFGRAVTVHCEPPDFGAVLHAVDLIDKGEVLVIAANGNTHNAMIGEILGGHLRARGVAGVICDGAVRDAATLTEWQDFPVYARAINPRGPVGAELGEINRPVMVGLVNVAPGDIIMGDADGLVALSGQEAQKWIEAAESRLETEGDWVKRLEAGETMQSLFRLTPAQRSEK